MKIHLPDGVNYPLHITHYKLNPKLPDFLRQAFNTVLVLPRQVVDFLHGVVNLLNARRHLIHAVFDDRRELVEFPHFVCDAFAADKHFFRAVFDFHRNGADVFDCR